VDFVRLMAFDWRSKDVTSLIDPLYPVKNQLTDNRFNNIVSLDEFNLILIRFFDLELDCQLCYNSWHTPGTNLSWYTNLWTLVWIS
jgi:hypothetical protein